MDVSPLQLSAGGGYRPVSVSAYYLRILDYGLGAVLRVEFTTARSRVVDYAVVLLLTTDDGMETVRVYDGAHGENEMHRYTRGAGKQAAVPFHAGTLGAGMRAAIEEIEHSYRKMIDGWRGHEREG